jgi:fatty acid desaturase
VSGLTENQRMQLARPELSVQSTGVQVRSRRGLVAYTLIAGAALVALSYAAIQALDGWAMFVVLAGIVTTAIGGAIAVLHGRKVHSIE